MDSNTHATAKLSIISLKQPFSKSGLQTLWVPHIFQGFDEVNTINNNNDTKTPLAFLPCWNVHWWCKSNGGVTLLAAGTNQTVLPNYTHSHCNLHNTPLAGKNLPVSLKTIFDKTVKKIMSQPLNTSVCNILCDKMEVCKRCCCYIPKYEGYFEEKYFVIEYWVKLAVFSWTPNFTWKSI